MYSTLAALPAWVYKRDGRLAPFSADEIALTLFEATESTGAPNAFLARELTESVKFFLTQEASEAIPSTALIAELTTKVIRELGHAALAKALLLRKEGSTPPAKGQVANQGQVAFSAADSSAVVVQRCLRSYSLNAIFSRDLAAAQTDGLITIHGLAAPSEVFAALVEMPAGLGADPEPTSKSDPRFDPALWLIQALENVRSIAGCLAVLDGLEYASGFEGTTTREFEHTLRQLQLGIQTTGLSVSLHVNCSTPPAWADDRVDSPLFGSGPKTRDPKLIEAAATFLLDHYVATAAFDGRAWLDWHLHERDFQDWRRTRGGPRLARLARFVVERKPLAFTFDRPRRPVGFGLGLDRKNPATLLAVSLHLPRLLEIAGLRSDRKGFLNKLPSLVSLAVSAAVQKRNFLRDANRTGDRTISALNRGFLLARSRLVVVPCGLESVVRSWTRQGICESDQALELGQSLLKTLAEVIHDQARDYNLGACLGGWDPQAFAAESFPGEGEGGQLATDLAPDLTAWDAGASLLDQVRAAGQLHRCGDQGTATVLVPHEKLTEPAEVADLLYFAWKETFIQRLQFQRIDPSQLTI